MSCQAKHQRFPFRPVWLKACAGARGSTTWAPESEFARTARQPQEDPDAITLFATPRIANGSWLKKGDSAEAGAARHPWCREISVSPRVPYSIGARRSRSSTGTMRQQQPLLLDDDESDEIARRNIGGRVVIICWSCRSSRQGDCRLGSGREPVHPIGGRLVRRRNNRFGQRQARTDKMPGVL